MDADVFGTPEDAARGDIPARFVRVVGVVVRGDAAVVAQLTNDRPPFEVETAHAYRQGDGWVEGESGNSTSGYLPASEGVGSYVVWDEAPADAVAARFEYDGRQQVVAVEDGCAFAVFDDVSLADALSHKPRLAAWVDADGVEDVLPVHEIPDWLRARMEAILLGEEQGTFLVDLDEHGTLREE